MKGKIDPPSAEMMAAHVVPIQDSWDYRDWNYRDRVRHSPVYPTAAELVDYMTEHGIPSWARIEYGDCGSHMLVIDWTDR